MLLAYPAPFGSVLCGADQLQVGWISPVYNVTNPLFVRLSCPVNSIHKHGGVDLMGLKLNPLDLSSFSALTLLVGSFDP